MAFGSTLLYGVQLGIGVSVGCSLVTLIASSMRPPHGLLGRLPGTSIFVQSRRRNGDGGGGDAPKQAEGVAIFGFTAALHFANKDYYRDALFSAVERRGSEDVLERSRLESLRQQGHLQSFSDVVAAAALDRREQRVTIVVLRVRNVGGAKVREGRRWSWSGTGRRCK